MPNSQAQLVRPDAEHPGMPVKVRARCVSDAPDERRGGHDSDAPTVCRRAFA